MLLKTCLTMRTQFRCLIRNVKCCLRCPMVSETSTRAGRCNTSPRGCSWLSGPGTTSCPICPLETPGWWCNDPGWCCNEVIVHLNSTVIAGFIIIKQYILAILRMLFVLILYENLGPDGKQIFWGYYIFLENYWRDELDNDILQLDSWKLVWFQVSHFTFDANWWEIAEQKYTCSSLSESQLMHHLPSRCINSHMKSCVQVTQDNFYAF